MMTFLSWLGALAVVVVVPELVLGPPAAGVGVVRPLVPPPA